MKPLLPCCRWLLCAGLIALGPQALAEKADRDQPVNLEADRASVDDLSQTHVFEGHVVLTQGTMSIKSDKLVVHQDSNGFKNGVATANKGNLARFRVRRDDGNWIEGEAERIEHEAKTDITQFFNRAWVKNGEDEVRGQYIVYDGFKEQYSVTNGPDGTVVPGRSSRVTAILQPKKKSTEAAPADGPVKLQIAPGTSPAAPGETKPANVNPANPANPATPSPQQETQP